MDILTLKQERARLVDAAQKIHATAEGENRSKTGEEKAEFDRLIEEVRSIGKRVDEMETLRELSSDTVTSAAAVGIDGRDLSSATVDQAQRTDEYRSAFEKYLRFGRDEMTSDERAALKAGVESRADMLTTAATAGGYVVPIDFANFVISKKVPAVAVRRTRALHVESSNGQALPIPVQSAFGAAAYLTEGSAGSSVADTGAKVTLNANTVVRQTAVSYQLLQDSAVDVATLIGTNFASAFGLFEDGEFVKGAGGANAVTGVVPTVGVGATCPTGNTLLFRYADILATYFSVQPQYRAVGEWLFGDTELATLAGLVDSQNRPIWTASMIPGEPDSLMGKPLYSSPQFTAPGANVIAAVFGDWANGYVIRDVGSLQIKRSDERRIDQLESLFVGWERIDGNVTDTNALKSMKHSAT